MREILSEYLNGHLSRRGFLQRLVAAGFTASAARSVVEASEVEGPAPTTQEGGGSYTITGTGGDLITEQVRAAGTKYIFTNPGSTEAGFFDALTDRPELQIIMGLHEGVVISMADAYYKVSRKPAFMNVHAISGTGQIGGQMYNVHRDGSGLVITAGLNDITLFSDDLHQAPAPGGHEMDISDQFTKLSWEVRNGSSSAIAIRRAYKLATTAPGGPVFVAFSSNALREKVRGEIWPGETFMFDVRPRPAADMLEKLARMLLEAERPAILFGDEVWKTGAQGRAVELAELLGLAAGTGQQAMANFPTQHPQYVGRLGGGNRPYPFGSYDLMVQMGARDSGSSSVPESIRSAAPYVGVGIDTSMLARTTPLDLAIVADVNETMKELIDAVNSLATKERLSKIRAARLDTVTRAVAEARAAQEAEARKNFDRDPIHPDRLDYELAKAIDRHAIVAMETLTATDNFMNYGYREDEKMRLWSNGTALGWGMGAAMGAQLGAPERQVVLSIGDGSLMYSASGFWTMARYGIPVLVIVWNNRNYQTVRLGFNRYGGRMADTGHYHGMYLGDPDIDYVGLAASQGVEGMRVESVSELGPALQRGVQETLGGKPFLVDVAICRIGGGAESTWYRKFNLAEQRNA